MLDKNLLSIFFLFLKNKKQKLSETPIKPREN